MAKKVSWGSFAAGAVVGVAALFGAAKVGLLGSTLHGLYDFTGLGAGGNSYYVPEFSFGALGATGSAGRPAASAVAAARARAALARQRSRRDYTPTGRVVRLR